MRLTPHHAKYYAHDLTRRAASGMDRLSMALFDAAVDLNPHQMEAALFALQSPLSKGVILADEVGLGKTIVASEVIRRLAEVHREREDGQPPQFPPDNFFEAFCLVLENSGYLPRKGIFLLPKLFINFGINKLKIYFKK